MIKGVKIILIFILLGFIMYQNWPFLNEKYNIPKTSFKKLDDEHYDMFKSLDEFHKHCKKHWDTEEKLYNEGKKKMPKDHKNIDKQWEEHNNEHRKFIKRIEMMKEDIVKHIEKYDQPHFHFKNYL
jgi:hemerythrin